MCSFIWGIGEGFLGRTCLIAWGTARPFSRAAAHFTFVPAVHGSSEGSFRFLCPFMTYILHYPSLATPFSLSGSRATRHQLSLLSLSSNSPYRSGRSTRSEPHHWLAGALSLITWQGGLGDYSISGKGLLLVSRITWTCQGYLISFLWVAEVQ